MKVELHVTETTPPLRYAVSGMVTHNPERPTDDVFKPGSLMTLLETDETVVHLSTDDGMTAADCAALLRSVANSLSPRGPEQQS